MLKGGDNAHMSSFRAIPTPSTTPKNKKLTFITPSFVIPTSPLIKIGGHISHDG